MTEIRFTIPGKALGKGRPRFSKLPNGKVVTYTPERTRSFEAIVRDVAERTMGLRERFECPIELRVTIFCDVPASWPEWKRQAALEGRVKATTKPDLDNAGKLLCDALNGVVWRDDVQVVGCTLAKLYGPSARMEVEVHAYEEMLAAQVKNKPGQRPRTGQLFESEPRESRG